MGRDGRRDGVECWEAGPLPHAHIARTHKIGRVRRDFAKTIGCIGAASPAQDENCGTYVPGVDAEAYGSARIAKLSRAR